MPEVKDLHEAMLFTDPIVDQNGSMHEQANVLQLVNRAAYVRKFLQQIDVVENCLAESLGGCRETIPRVSQDFLEVC
jgi:hypothetical protein